MAVTGSKAASDKSKKLIDSGFIDRGDRIIAAVPNTKAQNVAAIKDILGKGGTGSFADLPINLIRALPPVKKRLTDEKYNDFLYKYQKKLIDVDRSAGSTLAKGKLLKKLFTEVDLLPKVRVVAEGGKSVQALVPTSVTRASAPIDKVKRLALPLLALYGVGSIIDGRKSRKEEEGDTVVQKFGSSSELANLRGRLIEKVSSTLAELSSAATAGVPYIDKYAKKKIVRASVLLKQASSKISDLEDKNGELTEENKTLQLQVLAKERSRRAVKLANDMARKNMIKHAELEEQVDYIMNLNDDNFNILNSTVNSVPVKKADTNVDSLDKLGFISMESDSTNEKPSLEEAILRMKF